jgi:hypothetical protein
MPRSASCSGSPFDVSVTERVAIAESDANERRERFQSAYVANPTVPPSPSASSSCTITSCSARG